MARRGWETWEDEHDDDVVPAVIKSSPSKFFHRTISNETSTTAKSSSFFRPCMDDSLSSHLDNSTNQFFGTMNASMNASQLTLSLPPGEGEGLATREEVRTLLKQERDHISKRERGARRALYAAVKEEQHKRQQLEDQIHQEREERAELVDQMQALQAMMKTMMQEQQPQQQQPQQQQPQQQQQQKQPKAIESQENKIPSMSSPNPIAVKDLLDDEPEIVVGKMDIDKMDDDSINDFKFAADSEITAFRADSERDMVVPLPLAYSTTLPPSGPSRTSLLLGTSGLSGMIRPNNNKNVGEVEMGSLAREGSTRTGVEAMVKSLLKKELEESFSNYNPETSMNMMDPKELMDLVDKRLERKEEEDEEWHSPFGESVYTLLYMCSKESQGFWYGVFIYFIQMATISLTLVDVLDTDSASNPLKIPAMVDPTVTISQGVTMVMLLTYMSDLLEAVLKLQDGFYPEVLEQHPGATFSTWLISVLAQLSAGLLLLITSFILIMQAETVIDLMLNQTALLFMAEIDDVSFAMAKTGFYTSHLQEQAEAVLDFKVPKHKRRGTIRRILYFLAFVGLFIGYGTVKQYQLDGYFLSTYIYVQFGDAYNPLIPYYSGLMKSTYKYATGYREYRDLGTTDVLLAYCPTDRCWSFSEHDDPCDYFARSTPTRDFDVTAIPDSEWQVVDSMRREHPFDSFSLVSRDCDPVACQGVCLDGLCQCPDDQFGMDCEFANVCRKIVGEFPAMTLYYEGLEQLTKYAVSDEFDIMKDPTTGKLVKVYDMPVYYSNRTYPANVIFFGGRRWIFTIEWYLIDYWAEVSQVDGASKFFFNETVKALQGDFHPLKLDKYVPIFFSDPVDFETPDFLPTPSGLGWWSSRLRNESAGNYEPDYALETRLTCRSCFAEQGGYCNSAGGICNATTGLCDCQWDYFGDQCELQAACYDQKLPCNGNGICDKNSGECRCYAPMYDKLCRWRNLCISEDGKCQNGGVCNEVYLHCDCPPDPALDGDACERFADCKIFGCAHGGFCALDGKCVCRAPFHGILCNLIDTSQEKLFCSQDDDCLNGTCDAATGICNCDDPASYGTLCEHRYGCSWGGCLNGGMCNPTTNVCDCPAPFFGPDCSQEPVCHDDAYCGTFYGPDSICDTYTGTCKCGAAGPRSKQCFTRFRTCREAGCNNHGICLESGRCECNYPYTGRQCEYILEEYDREPGWNAWYREYLTGCMGELGFPPYNQTHRCE